MKKNPTALDVFGVPSEDEEQIQVVKWAEMQMGRWPDLQWLYHIPNGGKRRRTEAARFKAMGVKAGVPDLCLPVPKGGYHGLYIEMKRQEGGKLSKDQRDWIEGLDQNGYCVCRCDGARQAIAVLEAYMRGRLKLRSGDECRFTT
ncbi:MAG: VRR-NUC domain-containing protein [Oscillospiraceae bacterium]|nr:VRR-NUC domain-containing protein [Oscillospiraceae bacterium]